MKADTLGGTGICSGQFRSTVARGSGGPFTAVGGTEVGIKGGILKLLNGLNIHRAPEPDDLRAGVVEGCSSEIAPVLACIYGSPLLGVLSTWRSAT